MTRGWHIYQPQILFIHRNVPISYSPFLNINKLFILLQNTKSLTVASLGLKLIYLQTGGNHSGE